MTALPHEKSAGDRRRWLWIATAVFVVAAAAVYGGLWLDGPERVIAKRELAPELRNLEAFGKADATFCAWLTGRNAYTLLHDPLRLFDTEHCAPMERSMVLCVSMITMGLLGIPLWLVTGDPLVTYNGVLVVQSLLTAAAMYLVIASWTGVPAAGIVAGLLYGFHPVRLANVSQPSEMDTVWTLLAVFFALRLFAHGRWRDAIGVAAAGALLIGASFYQTLGTAFFVPPFVVWLVVRYRFQHVRATQLLFIAAVVGAAAAAFLGPYLAARDSESLLRESSFLLSWSYYLPGERLYPGLPIVALALIGLVARRTAILPTLDADPRWSLAASAALLSVIVADELQVYPLLASVIPGLSTVRVVFRLGAIVIMTLALFAGLGAAALIRRSARWRPLSSAALIAFAAILVVFPVAPLQLEYRWLHIPVRPSDETLRFYAELERLGNDGPILELPFTVSDLGVVNAPANIMASAFHRRRTSECYGSYIASGREEIAQLADRLPSRDAVDALRAKGFTTVVLHLESPLGARIRDRLHIAASNPEAAVRLILSSPSLNAYEFRS